MTSGKAAESPRQRLCATCFLIHRGRVRGARPNPPCARKAADLSKNGGLRFSRLSAAPMLPMISRARHSGASDKENQPLLIDDQQAGSHSWYSSNRRFFNCRGKAHGQKSPDRGYQLGVRGSSVGIFPQPRRGGLSQPRPTAWVNGAHLIPSKVAQSCAQQRITLRFVPGTMASRQFT